MVESAPASLSLSPSLSLSLSHSLTLSFSIAPLIRFSILVTSSFPYSLASCRTSVEQESEQARRPTSKCREQLRLSHNSEIKKQAHNNRHQATPHQYFSSPRPRPDSFFAGASHWHSAQNQISIHSTVNLKCMRNEWSDGCHAAAGKYRCLTSSKYPKNKKHIWRGNRSGSQQPCHLAGVKSPARLDETNLVATKTLTLLL